MQCKQIRPATVQPSAGPKAFAVRCQTQNSSSVLSIKASQGADAATSRRALLLSSLALTGLQLAQPEAASASAVQDLARGFFRPDVTPEQAVVDLLDARSTLREIEVLAATPLDSTERFNARKLWPSFAKRLRTVAEAGPVIAALVTGSEDKESTLSELYGGTGNEGSAVTDAVYRSMGFLLTLSGRTIQEPAQVEPRYAREAAEALDVFLAKVPKDMYDAAQAFRAERAAAAAAAAAGKEK